jgi:hypothetical protein
MNWTYGSPSIHCHLAVKLLLFYRCQSGVTMIDSDLLEDFEWHRDKEGYRLERDSSFKPLKFKSLKLGEEDVIGSEEGVIVPKGGPSNLIRYQPFARGGDLCTPFASIKTAEELLRFVNYHGPLTAFLLPLSRPNELLAKMRKFLSRGEPVDLGLEHAKIFADLLRLKSQGNTRKLASYFESDKPAHITFRNLIGRVELVGDPNKGLRLKICPTHLLGALWYQLGLKLSTATLRSCRLCHKIFEVGAGTRLRADATFCCYEHKVEFFNRNRPRLTQSSKRSS